MKSGVPVQRRHDLDALRAVAMLLGIVLHAALSFAPIPWSVQDSQQSDFYYVLFAFIHGFRMPMFFMLSGFFTAMLWRRRGLTGLLNQRFKRIFLPLVIGCFTIIPAMWLVGFLCSSPSPGAPKSSLLFEAVSTGDIEAVKAELSQPNPELDQLDSNSGSTPLATAVFIGETEIVKLLVEAGADVNLPNRDQAAPIHVAVFMGRAEEAKILLEAGVDLTARDGSGFTPAELLNLDFGTTNFIASSLGVPLEEETLVAGRKEIAAQLGENGGADFNMQQGASLGLDALYGLFFQLPAFMHLWFLAFLCWLVIAFLLYTLIARSFNFKRVPSWVVCSPFNLLWLIPLTMLPEGWMQAESFGPDASVGLFPIPVVLAYYAIFFFFGALYWEIDDRHAQLGRWWYVSLPCAIFVVFPVALDSVSNTFGFLPEIKNELAAWLVPACLQATFAWLMTIGSIGLFRQLFGRESRVLRYLSDSAYWLYLAHLPLVLLAQWLVRELPLPAFLKYSCITIGVSCLLLLVYEYGVRYTIIGTLLNGPRTRNREKAIQPIIQDPATETT